MVSTVKIGKRFRAGNYRETIDTLDNEFWANVPKDQELVRKLMVFVCGSAYYLNAAKPAETMKELAEKVKKARAPAY